MVSTASENVSVLVLCMALNQTGDHSVGRVVATISKHQVHINKKDNKTKRSVDEMTVDKRGYSQIGFTSCR